MATKRHDKGQGNQSVIGLSHGALAGWHLRLLQWSTEAIEGLWAALKTPEPEARTGQALHYCFLY